MIWKYALGGDDSSHEPNHVSHENPYDVSPYQLGIVACMCLSKAIYNEIASAILYDNRTLEFTISPERSDWAPSGLYVRSTKYNSSWHTDVYHNYHLASTEFCDGSERGPTHWHNVPFHKFKAVVINITPPDQTNPGELIVLWDHLTWLLDLLVNRQAPITEITFMATETKQWTADGYLVSSLLDVDEPGWILPKDVRPRVKTSSDVELLRLPIAQHNLLCCTTVELEMDGLHVMDDSQQQPPAGLNLAKPDISDVDDWSLYLDRLLDTLPGAAAKKLRTDRIATWWDDLLASSACGRKLASMSQKK